MLVLSRKIGERIVIDGGIIVSVNEVRGDRIILGIVAPDTTYIRREEVHNAIVEHEERERELAAATDGGAENCREETQ